MELLTLGQTRKNLKRAGEKFNSETDPNKKQELKKEAETLKKAYKNRLREEEKPKKRIEKELP